MKNKKGYTLMELILYLGIMAIMVTVLVSFYILLLENKVKSQTIARVQQEGTRAMEQIEGTVRNADGLLLPAPGATAASLSVDVADAGADPTIFALTGSQLQMTEGASAALDLTSNDVSVTSLDFYNLSQDDDAQNVRIVMTISHNNPAGTFIYNYSQTFYGSATVRKK